ncbi:cytochrome P450 [Trametes elegans]|nr:cytochrome P450 [Trametes elegans]
MTGAKLIAEVRFRMSVIFRLAYGRRVRTLQDDIVLDNIKAGALSEQQRVHWCHAPLTASTCRVSVPGKYLVESWPILLWLPRRLQWFRREVDTHRDISRDMYTSLMNRVREETAEGTAQPSMATLALGRQAEFGLSDLETAYTLAGPWDAGVGTTVASIEVFLLALLHFPDVQRKAQGELDMIVGASRMPDFSDMEVLPYVVALMKEVARWRPVAPTGFPHALTQDDVYNGWLLPKGATVYANIHAIMQDPAIFPEPAAFRPERVLNTTNPKLQNFTIHFGFGRRICPGLHVANQSIFIVLARCVPWAVPSRLDDSSLNHGVRLLWAFNIIPVPDADGKPVIPPSDDFTSGLITRPTPFPCAFEARSESIKELIVHDAVGAETEAARRDVH